MRRLFAASRQSVGLPAWVPEPGTFADISLNTPADIDPCPAGSCVYSRVSGQAAAFNAWTSGAHAPELGALGSYVCWGGGHQSYDGNVVFRCDLDTRLWSMLGSPSLYSQASNPVDANGAFPDGNPAPPHTYHTLGILPSSAGGGDNGSLIQATLPGLDEDGNGRMSRWWKFDFATGAWSQFIDSSSIAAGSLTNKTMVQEPGGHCWWFGGGYLTSIARVTLAGGITNYSIELNTGGVFCGGVVPAPRIAVLHGNFGTQQTWLFDLAAIEAGGTTASATKQVTPSGTAGVSDGSLTWCPDVGGFACFDANNPATVRWLKPSNVADPWNSTWAWSAETFTAAGGASARTQTNGAHGRFAWVPAIKCFLWAAQRGFAMQAYRPAGT